MQCRRGRVVACVKMVALKLEANGFETYFSAVRLPESISRYTGLELKKEIWK